MATIEFVQKDYLYASYLSDKIPDSNLVAGFDLDHTLIITKSGKTFPINSDDWVWFNDSVVTKLQKLSADKYKIIIFTNQKGIGSNADKMIEWRDKVGKIAVALGVQLQVYASLHNDMYRKPFPTFWNLVNIDNMDRDKSFFCGDACGREGDFSDTDLKFALNKNVKFYTPEEYFFPYKDMKISKATTNITYPLHFNNNNNKSNNNKNETYKFVASGEKEIILMVGFAASGKSSFVKNKIIPAGYECVNQDALKTLAKCIVQTGKLMKDGKNIVIDNTNPDQKTRKHYIDLAKKNGYHCRALVMNTDYHLSLHNMYYRHFSSGGEKQIIPNIAYNVFKKKYVKPEKDEGFDKIEDIEFNVVAGDNYFTYFY